MNGSVRTADNSRKSFVDVVDAVGVEDEIENFSLEAISDKQKKNAYYHLMCERAVSFCSCLLLAHKSRQRKIHVYKRSPQHLTRHNRMDTMKVSLIYETGEPCVLSKPFEFDCFFGTVRSLKGVSLFYISVVPC